MYKQLHFGRMQRRDLSRLMARVPELTRVYDLPYAGMIESLCGEAGKRLLEGLSDGTLSREQLQINTTRIFRMASELCRNQ